LITQKDDFVDVKKTQGGDGGAYRRLVERHQDKVSNLMWRFSRDPNTHRELVQEVFVELFLSLSGYKPLAPFSHWLARIATRVGYRFWKQEARKKSTPTIPLEDWDQVETPQIEECSPAEAAEMLNRLISHLPPRDRLVLTLRFLEDQSIEKTAELTGWSKSMVKVQTMRAKKKLKKIFESWDWESL